MRRGGLRWLRRFAADAQGSVAILTAAYGLCMIAALALGIDVASIYLEKRRLQGAADLASLAAARDLPRAEQAARATLVANGFGSPKTLVVTLGHYAPDPARPAGNRFRPNVAPMNAARVEIANEAPLFFGRGLLNMDRMVVHSRATAVNTELAAFSIGSRLASLDAGLANALLSGLLGGSVSLSAMDYQALAALDVDMIDLLDQLASRVGVTAGTYDSVLSADATMGDLAQALSAAGAAGGLARSGLSRLAVAGDGRSVDLGAMISLGPLGKSGVGRIAGVKASVSALEALLVGAGIASGARQIDLDLGTKIPGVLSASLSLAIGERAANSPWFALGETGAVVRTAQTRLRLVAQVAGSGGLPSIRLPIAVDVAAGEARLSEASCGWNPKTDASASLAVQPSVAEIWVGEPAKLSSWLDFAQAPNIRPATIVDALLLEVRAEAHVAATNLRPQTLAFSWSDIEGGMTRTARTTDAAQSTVASLIRGLALEVRVKGLGLGLSTHAVTTLLATTLAPVGAGLDPVLNALLDLLGVGIGEADVTVRGLRCDGSALVG